jgi:hypothetical protein
MTTEKLKSLDEEPQEPKIPFGDWLVRRGLIDRGQLFAALNLAYQKRFRIGDALVEQGVLSRPEVEDEASRHTTFRSFGQQPA